MSTDRNLVVRTKISPELADKLIELLEEAQEKAMKEAMSRKFSVRGKIALLWHVAGIKKTSDHKPGYQGYEEAQRLIEESVAWDDAAGELTRLVYDIKRELRDLSEMYEGE